MGDKQIFLIALTYSIITTFLIVSLILSLPTDDTTKALIMILIGLMAIAWRFAK